MQTRKDVKDHDQIIRQNVETKKRHVKPLQMTTKNSSNQKMSETRRESQFIRTMKIEEILVKSKDAKNRVSVHSNNEKILVKRLQVKNFLDRTKTVTEEVESRPKRPAWATSSRTDQFTIWGKLIYL